MTVADVCDLRNGHAFGPEDWGTVGLPIIRIQNLNGGKKFDHFSGVPEERWLVEPGQMLFSWAGTKGVSFGPAIWRGALGVLNQHIFKVQSKSGIDSEWLYWALKHVTNRIEAQSHGFKATLVHVKKSDIDRQPLAVPPIGEQRRIAQVLSTWDQAIATTERLLLNSQEKKVLLSQQMLTGKVRLKHFASSDVKQRTPYGSLPIEWGYRRIGELAVEVSQKLGDEEPYPVLSCTKHKGLVDSLAYFNKQVFSADTSTYKVVPRGSFVYATNHIDEGSIGYQDLYDFGLVSPMYTVFKANDEVDDAYLFALLKTEHYRQIFASATNASVDRRGSLRWKDFRNLRIPLPSIEEQRAIAKVLDSSGRETELIQAQLELLRDEKAALMSQLLTGKRRFKLPNDETEVKA
ncbi:restriction endonuclease subunit S [Stenotrophomonas maltophilia]|nr:restriction endonuclease subunit S [Stenotrophomonas maltophilia]